MILVTAIVGIRPIIFGHVRYGEYAAPSGFLWPPVGDTETVPGHTSYA